MEQQGKDQTPDQGDNPNTHSDVKSLINLFNKDTGRQAKGNKGKRLNLRDMYLRNLEKIKRE